MKPHVMNLLGAVGLVVSVSVPSDQAFARYAQGYKKAPPSHGHYCRLGSVTRHATATPSVDPADFPPLSPFQGVAVLNKCTDDQIDHTYRYIFNLSGLCRHFTKGTLTVKLKWLGGPGSLASNDSIAIYSNTTAGPWGYIWGPSAPFSTSTTPFIGTMPIPPTKTIVLPVNVTQVNTLHRLSFLVQDDTCVRSAVLRLHGCCSTHHHPKKYKSYKPYKSYK